MSDKDLNVFQLCSTSRQDKNRPLWQVIPQRKVFNTCFQISILKESKQIAGGHGKQRLNCKHLNSLSERDMNALTTD